jgi:hypothetical protein
VEESNALLNARIRAVEYQRDLALAEWARDRASLELANAAVNEQDAVIVQLKARIVELEPTPVSE